MISLIDKLKEYSETRILFLVTLLSLVFTVIFYFLMRPIEMELTSQTAYGVIDLEFAWNVERMEGILSSWEDELITKEVNAVLLDFGFLIFYSLALAGVTILLTKSGVFTSLTNIGYYFTLIPFLAALFDAIENVNLLFILTSPSNYPQFAPFVASICATIKFSLIIATVLFWFGGAIFSIVRRRL